jgi:hypothetical protein
MFNNTVLDVFIGLLFIFCLYSLFASAINEIIASALNLRGRMLKQAIRRMLTDESPLSALGKNLFDKFFNHGLIKYMNKGGLLYRMPPYITPANFTKILVDSIKATDSTDKTEPVRQIGAGLESLDTHTDSRAISSDTIHLLKSFLSDAGNDLEKFKANIEQWFNDMMNQASGWYKRKTQWIILLIGFCIAVGFNVNSIEIVKRLSKDKSAREQLALVATSYAKSHENVQPDSSATKSIDALVSYVDKLYKTDINEASGIIGLGWNSFGDFIDQLSFRNLLGWLITALAVSLGAPFWFDLLNKVIQLRGTASKPAGGTAS